MISILSYFPWRIVDLLCPHCLSFAIFPQWHGWRRKKGRQRCGYSYSISVSALAQKWNRPYSQIWCKCVWSVTLFVVHTLWQSIKWDTNSSTIDIAQNFACHLINTHTSVFNLLKWPATPYLTILKVTMAMASSIRMAVTIKDLNGVVMSTPLHGFSFTIQYNNTLLPRSQHSSIPHNMPQNQVRTKVFA